MSIGIRYYFFLFISYTAAQFFYGLPGLPFRHLQRPPPHRNLQQRQITNYPYYQDLQLQSRGIYDAPQQQPYITQQDTVLTASGSTARDRPRAASSFTPFSAQQPKYVDQSNAIVQATPAPITKTTTIHNTFSVKLFHLIGSPNTDKNMIYSPLSLQTSLAFLYIGARGQTAYELRTALEIPEQLSETARLFQELMLSQQRQMNSDMYLIMANKMYYDFGLNLKTDLYKRAIQFFNAEMEQTYFAAPDKAAAQINRWVAEKTHKRIQNIVLPASLGPNTQSILVNAMYMKANWAKRFSGYDTQKQNFHLTKGRTVPVDMMYIEDEFKYGELPGLNARAAELPFKDSDLSMLIIIPNDVDGLSQLESALGNTDLNTVVNALHYEVITLRLPKFRIQFEVDMLEPLYYLGIRELFTDNAQLNGFFHNQTVRVSKIKHKAYINVNEGGMEAAAASFAKLVPLSLPLQRNSFTADRPFMFAVRNAQAVYFIGHVVRF